jgi:hypothetical protein
LKIIQQLVVWLEESAVSLSWMYFVIPWSLFVRAGSFMFVERVSWLLNN